MASNLVKRVWVGPFVGELEDGSLLVPGETTVEVTAEQAESDHWAAPGTKTAAEAAKTAPKLGDQ